MRHAPGSGSDDGESHGGRLSQRRPAHRERTDIPEHEGRPGEVKFKPQDFLTRSHGPPWECRLRRSASSASARRKHRGRRASRTAFPRRAWERISVCSTGMSRAIVTQIKLEGQGALDSAARSDPIDPERARWTEGPRIGRRAVRSPRRGIVLRAGIRPGGAAVASSLALGLAMAASAGRAESLQDAWDAALAANQGLQAAQAGTASARSGVAAARAERLPTVTTVNAYTWLNNTPTFKSSLPLPGSPRPLNVSFPFLNREFFFSSTLMNIPLYTGGRITAGIDAAGGPGRGGPRRGVHRRHGPEAGGDSGVSQRPPRREDPRSWPGATSPASRPTSATCGTCSGRGSPSGPTCSPRRSRWRGPASG